MNSLPSLQALRKLGFGATIGAGIAGMVFGVKPSFFPGATFQSMVYIGAALGVALSHILNLWINSLLGPAWRSARHYLKLIELTKARTQGRISDEQATAILEHLHAEYFLGDTSVPVTKGIPRRKR